MKIFSTWGGGGQFDTLSQMGLRAWYFGFLTWGGFYCKVLSWGGRVLYCMVSEGVRHDHPCHQVVSGTFYPISCFRFLRAEGCKHPNFAKYIRLRRRIWILRRRRCRLEKILHLFGKIVSSKCNKKKKWVHRFRIILVVFEKLFVETAIESVSKIQESFHLPHFLLPPLWTKSERRVFKSLVFCHRWSKHTKVSRFITIVLREKFTVTKGRYALPK